MIETPGYETLVKDQKERDKLLLSIERSVHRQLTICEQYRFIYDIVYQLPDGEAKTLLTERIIDGFAMGKKMQKRLDEVRDLPRKEGYHRKTLQYLKFGPERRAMRQSRPLR